MSMEFAQSRNPIANEPYRSLEFEELLLSKPGEAGYESDTAQCLAPKLPSRSGDSSVRVFS